MQILVYPTACSLFVDMIHFPCLLISVFHLLPFFNRKVMDELSTNFGSFDEDSLMISQGNSALDDGQVDAACSYFVKVARDSANHGNVEYCHSKIAECHYRRGRWRDCMESAKVSLGIPDSIALVALSLLQRKDPHAAFCIIDDFKDHDNLSHYVQEQLEFHLPQIKELVESKSPRLPVHIDEKVKELKIQGNHKFKSKDFCAAKKLYMSGIEVLEDWYKSVADKPMYISDKEVTDDFKKLFGVLLSNLLNCEMNENNLNMCRDLCDKLLDIQGTWKKSYYWSAMCHLACFQFQEAQNHFNLCLSCQGSEKDHIEEKIEFVKFSEAHQSEFKTVSIAHWQEIFHACSKNMSWLAGNHFATSITKIYNENSMLWHMTTSALIDNYGQITNFIAPKYGASERDRNLINEMKRNEKRKFYIHLTQQKANGSQEIGFTETENLSSTAKLSLCLLEEEINSKGVFNAFVKNFLT